MSRIQIVSVCISLNVFLGLAFWLVSEYFDIDMPKGFVNGLIIGTIIALPGVILQVFLHHKYD